VPVYINPGLRAASTVPVRVGIFIDLEDGSFLLRPLADEIQQAVWTAQSQVGDLLASRLSDVPVFHGAP
jgi:hypothetical protein